MESRIVLPVEINSQNVDTSLKQIKDGFSSATTAVTNFNNEAGKSATLRKQFLEAKIELQRVSEAYGEASIQAATAAKKASELKDQIEDSGKLIDTFNPDQKFIALQGALNGVVGGFELVTGAQALFGEKSEELEQALLKVQGAMALSRAIDDISEAKQAFSNLGLQIKATSLYQSAYNFVMTGSTVATEGATVATLSFGAALRAIGIGLVIAAIALLVANFDKLVGWVMKGVDWFKSLGNTTKNVISLMFPIIGIIRGINWALEEMGIIDTDAEKQMKANAEEKKKRDEAAAVQALKNKDAIAEKYDFEIRKAQAAGKDTYELERQKQLAVLDTIRVYYKAMEAIVKSGDATKEQIEEWNAQVKAFDDIKKDMEVNEIAHKKELNDKYIKNQQDSFNKSVDNMKKYKDKQEKLKKDLSETLVGLEEDFNQRTETSLEEKERKLRESEIKQIQIIEESIKNKLISTQQGEEAIYQIKLSYMRKLSEAQMKEGENLPKPISADELKDNENKKTGIVIEAAKLKSDALISASDTTLKATKRDNDWAIASEEEKFQAVGGLMGDLTTIAGENTKAGKALGIAQATMNTYQGITEVWKAKSILPEPFNTASKIAATVVTAASGFKAVKGILSTKVPGGGGGGGSVPSQASTPFAAPQLFGIGGQQVKDISTLKDQKVIVTESDITRVQSRVSQVRRASVQGG